MTTVIPEKTHSEIIFLTHEFAPFFGGVATYVEEAANAVHRSNIKVTVWAPDYGKCESYPGNPFNVIRLRAGGSLKPFHQIQFMRELVLHRSELRGKSIILASVGAHLAFMMLDVFGFAGKLKITSLLHGSEILRFQQNFFLRLLAKRFYKKVGRVMTVSKYSRSLILNSFLSNIITKIELAPCARTTMATSSRPPKTNDDGSVRILTLARIHPRKGQLDVARALARLSEESRSKVIYQVAGTGDMGYLAQVSRVCQSGNVAFQYLGEITPRNLAVTYANCDIYAMTSRVLPNSVEGFGITYLDAGFHGKPVVAYRSAGSMEAVKDGESGILVPERNIDELTNAFTSLISDSSLRKKLGEGGRINAAEYDWQIAANIFGAPINS